MSPDYFEANEDKGLVECGMTGKLVPPEDTQFCNYAEGCDNCPHNQ